MLRRVKIDWADLPDPRNLEAPYPPPERLHPGLNEINAETFPAFLDEIGLVGMGGSGFPTAAKISAALGAHTLVVNGVECEPGVTIDQAVLLNQALWVAAGAHASAKAVGATHIILAVKNDPDLVSELRGLYPDFEIATFSEKYPAGAEKLILKKLTGKTPPPGARPHQFGYLVQNVVSLRAIGRALVDGVPVIERPLTLAMPSTGFYKNIIVPVGVPIRELVERHELPYDPAVHILSNSGLMMGREAALDDPVEKTTLSILVLRRDTAWRDERPCVRCGACDAACPLGLNPFTLAERVRKGKTNSAAFKGQMTECFLCGVCSAVCPSDIPLVQTLEKGKQCL